MSDSDRGVPRGDNVPAGEREENEQRSEHRAAAGEGTAQGREQHRDDVVGAGWVFSSDPAPGGSWGGPGTTPKTPQIPLYQRQIFCDF